LNFSGNARDYGIYEVLLEVFGEDGSYFQDFENEYNVFVARQKLHHLIDNPSQELLDKTKEEISELDLPNNNKVSKTLLRKLFVLNTSQDIEEFSQGNLQIDYMHLQARYEKLTEKNRSLKKKNRKLNKQLKKSKKLNEQLMSSSSWKITKPLRGLKRILK
jgi:hypothetical protein